MVNAVDKNVVFFDKNGIVRLILILTVMPSISALILVSISKILLRFNKLFNRTAESLRKAQHSIHACFVYVFIALLIHLN